MEGKEGIIERIISDAEAKAKLTMVVAESDVKDKEIEAKQWAEEYCAEQEKILDKDAKDIIERKMTVADLDVRKILLKAKQDVIDEVFSCVLKKLCSLDKKAYFQLVSSLIEENCDENDCIVLSKDGVLTASDIEKTPSYKAKGLTVSKDLGDFIGGVKLIGKVCDKDLSFGALIAQKKEGLSNTVAEKLFGKN